MAVTDSKAKTQQVQQRQSAIPSGVTENYGTSKYGAQSNYGIGEYGKPAASMAEAGQKPASGAVTGTMKKKDSLRTAAHYKDYKKIATLDAGTEIKVLDRKQLYLYVETDAGTGYVALDSTSFAADAQELSDIQKAGNKSNVAGEVSAGKAQLARYNSNESMFDNVSRAVSAVETEGNYGRTGDIGDGAGLSVGGYQFTEKSSLIQLVNKYKEISGKVEFNEEVVKHIKYCCSKGVAKLNTFTVKNGSGKAVNARTYVKQLLDKAYETDKENFILAQKLAWKETYFDPCTELMKSFGLDPDTLNPRISVLIYDHQNAGGGNNTAMLKILAKRYGNGKKIRQGDLTLENVAKAIEDQFRTCKNSKKYQKGWNNRVMALYAAMKMSDAAGTNAEQLHNVTKSASIDTPAPVAEASQAAAAAEPAAPAQVEMPTYAPQTAAYVASQLVNSGMTAPEHAGMLTPEQVAGEPTSLPTTEKPAMTRAAGIMSSFASLPSVEAAVESAAEPAKEVVAAKNNEYDDVPEGDVMTNKYSGGMRLSKYHLNMSTSSANKDEWRLHPTLRTKLDQLKVLLKENGLDFVITETMRSPGRQDALYAQGRTKKGKKVTNAKGWGSNHNYGCAADFALRVDGKVNWNLGKKEKALWEQFGQLVESVGLEWGGRWTNPVDLPHVQLDGLPKASECKKIYQKEGLEGIWSKF